MVVLTAWTYLSASDNRAEKDLEKMTNALQETLEKAFLDKEKRNSIIAELARPYNSTDSGMYIYRVYYESAFQDVLKRCETLLLEQINKVKEDAKKVADERTRIARDAKTIREMMIAPLQESIKVLQEKVYEICPKTQL